MKFNGSGSRAGYRVAHEVLLNIRVVTQVCTKFKITCLLTTECLNNKMLTCAVKCHLTYRLSMRASNLHRVSSLVLNVSTDMAFKDGEDDLAPQKVSRASTNTMTLVIYLLLN